MAKKDIPTSKMLSLIEVSERLNLSKSCIYKLTHRKKIPFTKVCGKLLFDSAMIDTWIAKHTNA